LSADRLATLLMRRAHSTKPEVMPPGILGPPQEIDLLLAEHHEHAVGRSSALR